MPKNVQIRNLDDATYEKLRARAAAEGMSLSQYLRRELDHLASLATMAEILERADKCRAEGGGVPTEAIVEALHAGRAERDDQLARANGHRAEIVVYARS